MPYLWMNYVITEAFIQVKDSRVLQVFNEKLPTYTTSFQIQIQQP